MGMTKQVSVRASGQNKIDPNGKFHGREHFELMKFMTAYFLLGRNQVLLEETNINNWFWGGTFQNYFYGIMVSLRKK